MTMRLKCPQWLLQPQPALVVLVLAQLVLVRTKWLPPNASKQRTSIAYCTRDCTTVRSQRKATGPHAREATCATRKYTVV